MFNVFPPKLTYSSFLFVTPKNLRNFAYFQDWKNNRNFAQKQIYRQMLLNHGICHYSRR